MNPTTKNVAMIVTALVLLSLSIYAVPHVTSFASMLSILFILSELFPQLREKSWGSYAALAISIVVSAATTYFVFTGLSWGWSLMPAIAAIGTAYWFNYLPKGFSLPSGETETRTNAPLLTTNKPKAKRIKTRTKPRLQGSAATSTTVQTSQVTTQAKESDYRRCDICGKQSLLGDTCMSCGHVEDVGFKAAYH